MDRRLCDAIPLHNRLKDIKKSDKTSISSEIKECLCYEKYENIKFQPIYEQWRAQDYFADSNVWLKRLSALDCDEYEFGKVLVPKAFSNINSIEKNLEAFLDIIVNLDQNCFSPINPHGKNDHDNKIDFCYSLRRVVEIEKIYFGKIINEKTFNNNYFLNMELLIENYLWSFDRQFKKICSAALVTELHYARNNGLLVGDTPEKRFEDYILRVTADSDWTSYFFEEYPALLFILQKSLQHSVEASTEIFTRINNDFPLISKTFSIQVNAKVMNIEPYLGDIHNFGRSASIINFSDETKIIYKPRPLQTDLNFHSLLEWITKYGFPYDHYHFKIIDQGEYGWMEYIEHDDCIDETMVSRFFIRQGSYLLLFYLLGGSDLLKDNIISKGEYPCLIDLECLFTPILPKPKDDSVVQSEAGKYFMESVIRSGMLPLWRGGDTENSGINTSALSALNNQESFENIWIDPFTDNMHQEKRKFKFSSDDVHLPIMKGIVYSVKKYIDDLIYGFCESYKIIMRNRSELLSAKSPLNKFLNCEVRVILRDTSIYARVYNEIRHPEYLQDAIKIDFLYENLWRAFSEVYPGDVIQSEIDQLWEGDIPYFYTFVNSNDLWDSKREKVQVNYFPESAWSGMLRRLERFSNEDMERQVRIIKQSLAIFESLNKTTNPLPKFSFNNRERVAQLKHNDLLQAAIKIGNRILDQSFRDDNSISWIDLTIGRTGDWEQTVLPGGIYSGSDGIALFLAYLYRASGCTHFRDAVEKIVRNSLNEFLTTRKDNKSFSPLISPFVFPMSTLYLLDHLRIVFESSWLTTDTIKLYCEWLEKNIDEDKDFDMISGASGAINLLLNLSGVYAKERLLKLAIICGDYILRNAVYEKNMVKWKGKDFSELGGFAHGTAGIAWTLFRLSRASNESRFYDAGIKALKYDRSLYRQNLNGWLDMRSPDKPSVSHLWCHGSAGIGLSRILISEYLDNKELGDEVILASSHIQQFGLGNNHCICHGDFGNLEILRALSLYLHDRDLENRVSVHVGKLIDNANADVKWRSGMPGREIDLLGLFMGLAGIGYQLLRFFDWENIPSVLFLESPEVKTKYFH